MPRMKKKEVSEAEDDASELKTLTATRSRRTIKPNRKYLLDTVVLSSSSKASSRSNSPVQSDSDTQYDVPVEPVKKPNPTPSQKRAAANAKQTPKTEPIKSLRNKLSKNQIVIPVTDIKNKVRGGNHVALTRKRLNVEESNNNVRGRKATPASKKADQSNKKVETAKKVEANKKVAASKKAEAASVNKKPINVRKTPLKPKEVNYESSDEEIEFFEAPSPKPTKKATNDTRRGAMNRKKLKKDETDSDFSPESDCDEYVLTRKPKDRNKVVNIDTDSSADEDEDDDEEEDDDDDDEDEEYVRKMPLPKRKTRSSQIESPVKEKTKIMTPTEKPKKLLSAGKVGPPLNARKKPVPQNPIETTTPDPVKKVDPIKSSEQNKKVSPSILSASAESPVSLASPAKKATITIVNISDIIKMKEKADSIQKQSRIETVTKPQTTSPKGRNVNPLVTSILERKRPYKLDNYADRNLVKRPRMALNKVNRSDVENKKPPASTAARAPPKINKQPSIISLMEDDDDEEIDFEDVLQTNIVTTEGEKVVTPTIAKSRRKVSLNSSSDENENNNSYTNQVPSTSPQKTNNRIINNNNNNNNVFKTNNNGKFLNNESNSSSIGTKSAPRILNSSLKAGNFKPFSKLVPHDSDKHFSIDLTDNDNNLKLVSNQPTKQNADNKQTGLRINSSFTNKANVIQNIPTKFGSPKMKKITCFETWYVINIPNNEIKCDKSSLQISMISLGNEIRSIEMPSDDWSYKITLVKLRSSPNDHEEVYTGDVQEKNIQDSEKHNYEPFNIMFRRKSSVPSKFNVQYDRAVVFKNKTFFINIDGKNCKLIGAPQAIQTIEEIETLLYIVDDINLKNTCVELMTTS